ncbi:hypothetical protein [Collimonas sp. OK607]|uniref:hypothetical protein n=1 Tax=Collimonas sp. OK607 TaxID=1798194 RepID=UPI001113AC86|nr:hypothetical protein [Collimonas sp. OK607]
MNNTIVVNRISPTAFIRNPAVNRDCETQSTEGINMKKLFGIAALLFALTPFAQAQNSGDPLAGHPDARNDRQMETHPGDYKHGPAKHHRKAPKKHHHAEEHKDEMKK